MGVGGEEEEEEDERAFLATFLSISIGAVLSAKTPPKSEEIRRCF